MTPVKNKYLSGEPEESTDEKEQENASLRLKLEEALKQVDELKESRNKLSFILSHDLRSPFNGLLGFTNFLADEIESLSAEEIKLFTANIRSLSKGLLELISDLSDWARIENGTIQLRHINLELHYMVNEVFHLLKNNAALKKITLINNIPPETYAWGDLYMITSVFQNLISNAIKFTRTDGKVTVGINTRENFYEISVADNGIGISDEFVNKLFKLDKYFTTRGTANEKGTGLGLILCKKLLEKNNGNISVKSEDGKGTEIIFTLLKSEKPAEDTVND